MTSLANPDMFAEGDIVHDIRNGRTGVITHRPERGTWVCLADPANPDHFESRWHVMYGDMRCVDNPEGSG